MKNYQVIIQYLLFCVGLIGATADPDIVDQDFPGNSYGDHYSNMAVHGGKVYIGAKNYIYVLNATDLREMQKVRTCSDNIDCNNKNVALLVNKQLNQLITCGDGNDGICEIRSLDDIRNPNSSKRVVSANKQTFLVMTENTNGIYAGNPYGSDSHSHYIANYSVSNDKLEEVVSLDLLAEIRNEYVVYFKSGLDINNFMYFFTNQKFDGETSSKWTSKIIRICQNDSEPGEAVNSFWSYTDIPLECTHGSKIYNLVQDVTVFKPEDKLSKEMNVDSNDWIIAATFTSGSRPDNYDSESAVCLYKLSEIDQNIMNAKRDFITCNESEFSGTRYLLDGRYSQSDPKKICMPNNTVRNLSFYNIGGNCWLLLLIFP